MLFPPLPPLGLCPSTDMLPTPNGNAFYLEYLSRVCIYLLRRATWPHRIQRAWCAHRMFASDAPASGSTPRAQHNVGRAKAFTLKRLILCDNCQRHCTSCMHSEAGVFCSGECLWSCAFEGVPRRLPAGTVSAGDRAVGPGAAGIQSTRPVRHWHGRLLLVAWCMCCYHGMTVGLGVAASM